MRTRVKICCIACAEEAALAVSAGADAIGLVAAMPSGPGPIPEDRIAAIVAATPPPVQPILLTALEDADAIADQAARLGVTTVQLVRHVDPAAYVALRRRAPSLRTLQVIHVEDEGALDLIAPYAPHVGAFLLDSGAPGAAVAELGGTGRVHDWAVSAAFVALSPRPVILAGGLGPHNAAEAIRRVRPYGLDLCSGLRPAGTLDGALLAAFMAQVARADRERP